MRKFLDLIRLVVAFPHAFRVFLRPEYDRLFPLFQYFARYYRLIVLRRTRIVAVIGSLGKTTTHRTVMAALDCLDRKFSFSNYGMSLAANLLRIRPGDRFGVLEAGIGGPGEMAPYARMIQPHVVVVTSIASDHFRTLPTHEETREEKVNMLRSLPSTATAILNGDDENVRWMATQTVAQIVTFGCGPDNQVRATDIEVTDDATKFILHHGEERHAIRSRLLGRHMVYPILAAATVALEESIELATALDRLAQVTPVSLRLEKYAVPSGVTILDDSFKSSIESVFTAFDTMAKMSAQRKIVVLGETGSPTEKIGDLHRRIGARLATFADMVICIGGSRTTAIRSGASQAGMDPEAVHLIGTRTESAIEFLRKEVRAGDLVLVKGSIRQKLQRVSLNLRGTKVSCRVKACKIKVPSCAECPLLEAPAAQFENHFIRRFIEP
ncbi:MAG: hypothetical protein SynsKO_14250 [Synoicihabitans sp.]